MKRTKIICTIGPSSQDVKTLTKMMKAGMNACRLNFSHGTYENHSVLLDNIRKAAKITKSTITIIQDLQGPRIRLGKLPADGVLIEQNKEYIFTTDKKYKDNYKNDKFYVTYENLHYDIQEGETILISDGLIKLEVLSVHKKDILAKVSIPGILKSNKGLNFPDTTLQISPITRKDTQDLAFGLAHDIDWVALSFVGSADHVHDLRLLIQRIERTLKIRNRYPIKILPKIEKLEAINNIDEIINVSDGIMIARGDLGIELPPYKVPILQKKIIEKTLSVGKPVVVATQMLESMIQNSRPTRAEVSDIANAVIDHTDCIMLSGETAGGAYPVESVQVMAATAIETELSTLDDLVFGKEIEHLIGLPQTAIGLIAGVMAYTRQMDALITLTLDGSSVSAISRFRPEIPVFVGTPDDRLARQLNLLWGVYSFSLNSTSTQSSQMIQDFLKYLKKKKLISTGQRVLCLIGEKIGDEDNLGFVKFLIVR